MRTNITTLRKISKTFTSASNVFSQIIQASQAKFKVFKKEKQRRTNKNNKNTFLSHVKLKYFLLKNLKFTRLNNIITKS